MGSRWVGNEGQWVSNEDVYSLEDGPFFALAVRARGGRSWVVFRDGAAVAGATSDGGTFAVACEAAELLIGSLKAADASAAAGVPQTVPGESAEIDRLKAENADLSLCLKAAVDQGAEDREYAELEVGVSLTPALARADFLRDAGIDREV